MCGLFMLVKGELKNSQKRQKEKQKVTQGSLRSTNLYFDTLKTHTKNKNKKKEKCL